MLVVNRTPAAAGLHPPSVRSVLRPRENDCDGLATRHCCRRAGDACRPRVMTGPNFARPEPPPPPPPKPSARAREARRRLRYGRQWAATDGRRTDVYVQCDDGAVAAAAAAAEPVSRAVQHGAAQTDLEPATLRQLLFGAGERTAVACKTGVDAVTQVRYRDLVDFETEAAHVAGPLVDGILHRAAARVMYEDDAAALRRDQAVYVARRRAERVHAARLEYAEADRRRRALRALADAERAAPGPTYRAVHGRAVAGRCAALACAAATGQLRSAGYLEAAGDRLTVWLRNRLRGRDGRVRVDTLVGDAIANRGRRPRQQRGP